MTDPTPITATARTPHDTVIVQVHPGGALHSLTLSRQAPALGGHALAAAIVAAVAEATARANQRTKHALGDDFGDVLTTLRLPTDPTLAERAEDTTPTTWRL